MSKTVCYIVSVFVRLLSILSPLVLTMKTRLLFLLRIYVMMLALFCLQKPLFMWIDCPNDIHIGITDIFSVMLHGMTLDVPMTGYLIVFPFFLIMATACIGKKLKIRRILTPYYIIVAILVSAAFIADLALYPFWQFKLDATIFFYLNSPQQAFASVSTAFIAWRVLAFAVYALVIAWLLIRMTPKRLQPLSSTRRIVEMYVAMLLLAAPLAISIRGGLGESTANIGKAFFSDKEFLNHSAVNPCFSMLYSLGKAESYADEFDYFDEDRRKKLFSDLYVATPSDTVQLLNTTRPNIILIIMEGFGGQFTDIVGTRKDITPNYNRLAREGVIFTNCYSNSFRTDRGMVSTLSGYHSFPTQSVMKLPVKSRTLPCIAQSLNKQGYKSSFLYGGDINFTNMQGYLRTGGYSTIVSEADFSAAERNETKWGVNDHITFNYLYDMASRQHRSPWHIGFLTLSSHEPWKVPYNRLKEEVPNAFAFTDACLGRFVERMRKSPMWDNLLIVCIPDHGVRFYDGMTHEQHHHNTMLWIGGAVKGHKEVNTLMSQSDMAATLLGQLRIPHGKYTFSRNVLSNEYSKYPFAFFTFKEGIGLRDSTGFTVYDVIGNKVIENTGNGQTLRTDKAKAILQSIYDDLGAR